MGERTSTEFTVRDVSALRHSPNGHPYVECKIDGGVVAVWGSPGKMGHIAQVTDAKRPFRMICDCIPSNWEQHDLWVYEKYEIYLIEPIEETPSPGAPASVGAEPLVSADELSAWRRQIAAWVTLLEGNGRGPTDGLAGRIGALSFSRAIPREIAALMKAITEMRNATEYDAKVLSRVESLAVCNAWLAVNEWARISGLAT